MKVADLRKIRQFPARRGTALVELAVCLPLLSFLMIASIDACAMIYTDTSLTIAAYEGTREGIRKQGTTADVRERCEEILLARRVTDPDITIEPADVAAAERGTAIRVIISCPSAGNTMLPSGFYTGKSLQASCTMLKE
jgi:Flp pilus assembly protein TadG